MNLSTIPSDQLAPLAQSIIEEMYRRLGSNFDVNTDETLTGAIDAIGEAGAAFEAERTFRNEPSTDISYAADLWATYRDDIQPGLGA